MTEGKIRAQFFSPFTDKKVVTMFTARRDAASSADLNKAVTVVLSGIDLTAYNTAHHTNYTLLPSDAYTLVAQPGVSQKGTGAELAFAPGDFAKKFMVELDGTKLDPSESYAIAYAVSDPAGLTVNAGKDTIISTIGIKNKWDGTYAFTGTMVDATNSNLTHVNDYLSAHGEADGTPAPMQYELRTISATECEVYDNYYYGGNYMLINNNGAMSNYGSFALIVQFDPATDKVVAVRNYYGQPAANTRSAALDPSGANQYDAATKVVTIKYFMKQPSVVTAAPNVRTSWDEKWTYLGPR
ncbi:hypothetical protein BC343_24845 [Mucilaginibacter pedocola]|uniref:BT-3987-like N-terminal domain-containing protein n=1 Tax=Mucilaginibacter pedocola TaxID=1792845 RepID=A0A1S9PHU1_9SPHI|nr:hypothetical protein BC343_24845 [Mucilaginibacter pedocola]